LNELPHYYSRLSPFRELFLSGQPLLTYHHVGPRPARVRLKGLYVSAKLFGRQIEELREAGFSTPRYDELAAGGNLTAKTIFVTFDDGFHDIFENALSTLQKNRFIGIEFLVADLLGETSEWQVTSGEVAGSLMDKSQIQEWLAAGNQIGSHTLNHARLTQVPIAEAKEQITASKKKLEDLFGRPIHHFCYPYGDCNPAVRDLVEQAGYHSACTTRFGVNGLSDDRFLLKRITARYESRNWKNLWRRVTLRPTAR